MLVKYLAYKGLGCVPCILDGIAFCMEVCPQGLLQQWPGRWVCIDEWHHGSVVSTHSYVSLKFLTLGNWQEIAAWVCEISSAVSNTLFHLQQAEQHEIISAESFLRVVGWPVGRPEGSRPVCLTVWLGAQAPPQGEHWSGTNDHQS